MKERIRVLLIFPNLAEKNSSPPLGLGYIASVLDKRGCEVKIIDAAAISMRIDDDTILQCVWEFRPHIVGIHLIIVNIMSGYSLAREISRFGCLLVAGGPHASVLPHEPLQHGFDVTVRGEGELTMVDLVRHVEGELDLPDIPGISYRKNGKAVDNLPRDTDIDLDSLPMPAFHLFDRDHYRTDSRLYQFAGSMAATRGCPFSCTFCFKGVFGDNVKMRSAENIANEIRYVHDNYGVTFINFIDEFFTLSKPRLERFCELLIEKGPVVEWMANSRVDAVDRELLRKMKKAGCYMLHYGIESVDNHSLEQIKKHTDDEKILGALQCTKEAGIRTQIYIMSGFPWDTPQTVEKNIQFLTDNSSLIDEILNRAFVVPYPGTEFYEKYHRKYKFTNWWFDHKHIERFSLGEYVPLHNRIFFHDYRLIQKPVFDYSLRTRWKIRKLVSIIGRKHLELIVPHIYYNRLKRNVYLFILWLSSTCHNIDWRFGRFVMNLIYRAVYLISPGKARYLK